jgi:hypothetical protein
MKILRDDPRDPLEAVREYDERLSAQRLHEWLTPQFIERMARADHGVQPPGQPVLAAAPSPSDWRMRFTRGADGKIDGDSVLIQPVPRPQQR